MTSSPTGPRIDPRLQEAREFYKKLISPEVEAANLDRLVVIDTESEDFEIGDDLIELSRRMKSRRPSARIVGFRVGEGGGPVDRFISVRVPGSQP